MANCVGNPLSPLRRFSGCICTKCFRGQRRSELDDCLRSSSLNARKVLGQFSKTGSDFCPLWCLQEPWKWAELSFHSHKHIFWLLATQIPHQQGTPLMPTHISRDRCSRCYHYFVVYKDFAIHVCYVCTCLLFGKLHPQHCIPYWLCLLYTSDAADE